MHALRAPLLGMMVAVGILVVENVGANAYRICQQREHAGVVAEAGGRETTAALLRTIRDNADHRSPPCGMDDDSDRYRECIEIRVAKAIVEVEVRAAATRLRRCMEAQTRDEHLALCEPAERILIADPRSAFSH
jgi:hypothetical protein